MMSVILLFSHAWAEDTSYIKAEGISSDNQQLDKVCTGVKVMNESPAGVTLWSCTHA